MHFSKQVRWTLGLLILIAPLLAYVVEFGPNPSDDHNRWGTFGSYLSGIYTPLLTIITLLLLRRQIILQARMNDHQYDQAYVQQARSDVEFYLTELGRILNVSVGKGHTLGTFVAEAFEYATLANLDSEALRATAKKVHISEPRLIGLIHGIQQVLGGLDVPEGVHYRLALTSGRQKAVALIGFPMLVALEHYERACPEFCV